MRKTQLSLTPVLRLRSIVRHIQTLAAHHSSGWPFCCSLVGSVRRSVGYLLQDHPSRWEVMSRGLSFGKDLHVVRWMDGWMDGWHGVMSSFQWNHSFFPPSLGIKSKKYLIFNPFFFNASLIPVRPPLTRFKQLHSPDMWRQGRQRWRVWLMPVQSSDWWRCCRVRSRTYGSTGGERLKREISPGIASPAALAPAFAF